MAVVTSDFLAGLLTNFQQKFQETFDAAVNLSPWRELAIPVTSRKLIESYNWLGTVPVMVDVTSGDMQVEGLFSFNFNLQNLVYKSAVEVQRAAIEDDELGMIPNRIADLGFEAARHPGALIFALVASNPNAFDGVSFFNATRTIGRSANIANSSSGTGLTMAAIQTDLQTMRSAMRLFQDDQGRPMNNVVNYIMVPPTMEQVMYQALSIQWPSASPNVAPVVPATQDGALTAGTYRIIVNPFLTANHNWYGFAIGGGSRRPFIYQERIPPSLEGVTTPDTAEGVIRDRFIYSVRARYQVGPADPRYAYQITNA